MRVTSSYAPNLYRQQTKSKASAFSDVLANMVSSKPTETGKGSGGVEVVGTPVSKNLDYPPFRLLASKVDTTRKLNADSKGDVELTDEHIQSLKEKYDFDNLSMQDQYDLYCDLTDMGVLTATEVDSIGMSNISLKGKGVFSRASENLFPLSVGAEYGNLQEWMRAFVEKEQAEYDYILDLGEKVKSDDKSRYDPSVGRAIDDCKKNSPEIDKMMAAHKKVTGVFEALTL